MEKKLLSEIEQMKYMFGYKRGVVISEQNLITEKIQFEDTDSDQETEDKLNITFGDKWKYIQQCLKDKDKKTGLKIAVGLAQLVGATAGGVLSSVFPPVAVGFGVGAIYAAKNLSKDIEELKACVEDKIRQEDTFIPPDSEPSPDQMQDMM